MESFGEFMREIRKSKGLTITELSKLSGVSQPHISNIENGKRNAPPPEILNKLAPALGISPLALMKKAGHTDEQALTSEKLSFTANMIVNQILNITSEAKNQTEIQSVKNYIEHFEEELIAGADGKNVTTPELKKMLWYLEGDGDSYKSTIGRRSDSSKIETLLDALDSVMDTEHRAAREAHERKKEIDGTDIVQYLTNNFVSYNNHPLTDQDKQRVLDMLKALFPEYQDPAK